MGVALTLLRPIKVLGRTIERIELRPFTYEDMMRWRGGAVEDLNDLLADIAGIERHTLMSLTYPDVDRLMDLFMVHVPPEIRTDIANGRVPTPPPYAPTQPPPPPFGAPPAEDPPEDMGLGPVPEGPTADFIPGLDEEPQAQGGLGGFDMG